MLKQTSESEYFGRYKIGSKKKCRLIYNIQYTDATTDHITPCSRMRARGSKVYVTDTDNHRILVLNPDLTFSSTFGKRGSGKGQFDDPCGQHWESVCG